LVERFGRRFDPLQDPYLKDAEKDANNYGHVFMPRTGLELTVSVLERSGTTCGHCLRRSYTPWRDIPKVQSATKTTWES